jgi:hypothetical protein
MDRSLGCGNGTSPATAYNPAPLSAIAVDAPLAARLQHGNLSMHNPPLSFLDRLASPKGAGARDDIAAADKDTEPKTGSSKASTPPAGEALRRARSGDGWTTVSVEVGDNLWTIFTRLYANRRDLHEFLELPAARSDLGRLHPGETLKLRWDHDHTLRELLRYDTGRTLQMRRVTNRFRAIELDQPLETLLHQAAGIIRTFLFESGQAAGLSDRVIMELAEIFAWDIDFALDIRPGDRFSVLYEEHYLDMALYRSPRS